MKVFGIKNCSAVLKVLTWFDSHQITKYIYALDIGLLKNICKFTPHKILA